MIKKYSFRQHSKYDTNKLINNSNHSLFPASKLFILPSVILLKHIIPHNYACSHLIKNVPQMRITLLRNTHLNFPPARLLYNRISPCITYKLLSIIKPVYIFNLSNKPTCKPLRNSSYRRYNLYILTKKIFHQINKNILKIFNLLFRNKLLMSNIRETFKAAMLTPTRIFCQINNLLCRNRTFLPTGE